MAETLHAMSCADAASITGEFPVHESCIVILSEVHGEDGWTDGGIPWASHFPSIGVVDYEDNEVGLSIEDRLGVGQSVVQDWTQDEAPTDEPKRAWRTIGGFDGALPLGDDRVVEIGPRVGMNNSGNPFSYINKGKKKGRVAHLTVAEHMEGRGRVSVTRKKKVSK